MSRLGSKFDSIDTDETSDKGNGLVLIVGRHVTLTFCGVKAEGLTRDVGCS